MTSRENSRRWILVARKKCNRIETAVRRNPFAPDCLNYPMERARIIRVGITILAAFCGSGPIFAEWMQPLDWDTYRSERFGFSLLFPARVLEHRSETPDGRGVELSSKDGLVRLKVLAADNTDNISIGDYRAAILREFSGGNQLQYSPMGQSWFVLSGVRGDSIYYQKVLFACGGRIINAFALTYPEQQRRKLDPAVTTIEKNFHPTAGPDCYR